MTDPIMIIAEDGTLVEAPVYEHHHQGETMTTTARRRHSAGPIIDVEVADRLDAICVDLQDNVTALIDQLATLTHTLTTGKERKEASGKLGAEFEDLQSNLRAFAAALGAEADLEPTTDLKEKTS